MFFATVFELFNVSDIDDEVRWIDFIGLDLATIIFELTTGIQCIYVEIIRSFCANGDT